MSDVHQPDTVAHAADSPELEQPYAELGLTDGEYAQIRDLLGRRPTAAELAMYSVMWSEHCAYSSSRAHLRQFGEKTTEEMRAHLLVGIEIGRASCREREQISVVAGCRKRKNAESNRVSEMM